MSPPAGLADDLDPSVDLAGGAALGVAVSGGSDSLALLHLLHDRGRAPLAVATVDHRLRPDSASEALHVARVCAGLGLPHDVLEWRGWDGRGNLQDVARRSRYTLLADWARNRDLGAVALAHSRDDVAETFLMRLSRGAGVDGLSAMRAEFRHDGVRFLRPCLHLGRDALRESIAARGVRWIEDPSNSDEVFERTRARKALGALEEFGIEACTLAAVAGRLAEARGALNAAAAEWAETHVRSATGDLQFDRTAFRALPPELQRRLLAAALRWVASAPYPPRRDPLADALAAVGHGTNTALHGCRVLVSDMTVRITREHAAVADLVGPTDRVWDGRWHLRGPHAPDLVVAALGEALNDCPGWRDTGLPRASLLASPAVWRDGRLVAAPAAGFENGWTVEIGGAREFAQALFLH